MKSKLEVKVIVSTFILLVFGVVVAFGFTVYFETRDVTDISQQRMIETSRIIAKSIERSMLEADAVFTRDLVDELKNISGYDLKIYNYEGREAFNKNARPVDDKLLHRVLQSGEELTDDSGEHLHTYTALINVESCRTCHANGRPVMGAVVLDISLAREYEKVRKFTWTMLFASLAGLSFIGSLLWYFMRRDVIFPIKSLESAATKMAAGDLSFVTNVTSVDEVGRLDRAIKDSLSSISGILERVMDVAKRVVNASDVVENESQHVLDGTLLESEAVAEISSSVEELNVAIAEIAETTQSLARSAQDSAASVEELSRAALSIKDITHEVSEGVETTTSSIQQFSASIKEVVENAEELSKVSDETLTSVEEITTTVKNVEASAKQSAELSRKVMDDSANMGISSIRKTTEGMEMIRDSVSKTAEAIDRLGGRSNEIGNILNVIEDITDQTTLLALNAAILAAQAGEHGKGFSVVANEIKDLAERTTLSTQEIDSLISAVRKELLEASNSMKDGIDAVDKGMALTRNTSGALSSILESARKSAEMSASIERTTTEQGNTARYVTDSIERVRYMVEHIVKATLEQSKGVQQVMEAAEKMKDAANQADIATEQQASGSRQILESVDHMSEMSQQISRALNEQKVGSKQIWMSVEKIKDIPEKNRDMAININRTLKELGRDVDLIGLEMERFKLHKESAHTSMEMAVVPFETPATMFRKLYPLTEYLSEKLGQIVSLKIQNDFDSAIKAFASGNTPLGFLTPMIYNEARKRYSVTLLAQALVGGSPTHRTAIVTREHSNISSMGDLKGRTMAFVDKRSSSGFILPVHMMKEAGVELAALREYKFLGYHEEVIKAVLTGEADAGAVMESVAARNEGDGLKVVKMSEGIPSFAISITDKVEKKTREDLFRALRDLGDGSSESNRVLGAMGLNVTGFTRPDEESYKKLQELANKDGVG